MNREAFNRLRSFAIELSVYALLVVVYVLLVLNFLSGWLKQIYDHGKTRYAIVCLLLIIGQGVVLETVTSLLLRYVRAKTE
ncbi:MAG TPA: hypothetical protein VKA60_00410 [Blastocatellia bacterium]|nr:hypothetical protein [Blastocatellia bacterium]